MKKKFVFCLGLIALVTLLFGCTNGEDQTGKEAESATKAESKEVVETKENVSETLTLPEGIPNDFPLPDPMHITEINDTSDEDMYSYEIRFTFDPGIDMDATFAKYKDYAEGLTYNIIIGGEEYFADGIFQFGAVSKFSADNMFIITLQPEGTTFGDITFKQEK